MSTTKWVILAVTVFLIGYDFYAVNHWGDIGTITDVIITASTKTLAIPFGFGFLMGHLFAHGDLK